ncbi:hypothetical protein LCGC14_1460890 [marine sediment metagenome]|uniref:Uncharacterized protein n=1 Tax=marine sediment metagenome TaxID=412755 RepID=A0A0F9LVR6_9ZZZZ
MFLRWQLPRNWRMTFTLAKIIKVMGVNSEYQPGQHVLMWDFDGESLETVVEELSWAQKRYNLPPVHIFSGRPGGESFHAYCFKLVGMREMLRVLAETPSVDYGFLKWTVFRGHATLRIGPKDTHIPFQIMVLPSAVAPDIEPKALASFVEYETLPRQGAARAPEESR